MLQGCSKPCKRTQFICRTAAPLCYKGRLKHTADVQSLLAAPRASNYTAVCADHPTIREEGGSLLQEFDEDRNRELNLTPDMPLGSNLSCWWRCDLTHTQLPTP